MIIKIEIDTTQTLSDEDKALLRALNFMDGEAPAATPAKKTAAKKATSPKPSAASDFPTDALRAEAPPASEGAVEEKPSEEPDEELRDAAVARASELLSNGGRDRVMAALKKAGAGRVSEIDAAHLPAFLQALTD